MADATLPLRRKIGTIGFTLGVLMAGAIGGHSYYSVEDQARLLTQCTQKTCVGKINGETAIPAGKYEVLDTYSPRFKRKMLELRKVDGPSGFQGVRIHSGNTADDVEGCVALGNRQTAQGVADSNAAMQQFNREARAWLAHDRLFINITEEE